MEFKLKSPKTSALARQRKQVGDEAESIVTLHCAALHRRKIATLLKLPVPYRVIRASGGVFSGAFTGGSPFDYYGYTHQSARFVAIEVKRTQCTPLKRGGYSAPRLDLDQLQPHQRLSLEAVDKAGGLAFVVLVAACGQNHRLFAVPWAIVAEAISNEEKSIGGETLYSCETPKNGILLEAELSEEEDGLWTK